MLSPKPGVSTTVREMRTLSSSSSADAREGRTWGDTSRRTDVNGLDADALFEVRILGSIDDLVRQDIRLAEGVHERRATSSRFTCGRLLHCVRLSTRANAPTTIRVNAIPFDLFPLRRPGAMAASFWR